MKSLNFSTKLEAKLASSSIAGGKLILLGVPFKLLLRIIFHDAIYDKAYSGSIPGRLRSHLYLNNCSEPGGYRFNSCKSTFYGIDFIVNGLAQQQFYSKTFFKAP